MILYGLEPRQDCIVIVVHSRRRDWEDPGEFEFEPSDAGHQYGVDRAAESGIMGRRIKVALRENKMFLLACNIFDYNCE